MRLLVVGEHVLLLQGLVQLLHEHTGAEVRSTVRPHEAEAALRQWRPSVVIVEASDVPAATGLLGQLAGAAAGVPLLVIAPGEREQFLAALRGGARGFVGRDATAEQLLECIDLLQRGDWGVPRPLIGELVQAYLALSAPEQRATRLTERERRILELLARGLSAQAIGRELHLSEFAVRGDIRVLTKLLGVTNRVQIVTEALRQGLLTPE